MHYERGDLVILSDVRIEADFDGIATIEPSRGNNVRKQKFVFKKSVNGQPESRTAVWERFFGERLRTDPDGCRRMGAEIKTVNATVDALVHRIFSNHGFSTKLIVWKFLEIAGENLHIDNLPNLNETTQVRMFVNVGNTPRRWSVGRHWQHYAEQYFTLASLDKLTGDAFAFNGKLNHSAFGPSWSTSEEPRHLVEFDPGEVWLINSALVAHQVRGGNRLCSTHYEYAYSNCMEQTETLPHLIMRLSRKHAQARLGMPWLVSKALSFLDQPSAR